MPARLRACDPSAGEDNTRVTCACERVMAYYRFFGCSAVPSVPRPPAPEPCDWKAEMKANPMTDTGVRMSVRGSLALCSIHGTEHVAITCGKCGKLSATIRAWSRCYHCGDFLMDLLPSDLPPSIFRVDWSTGHCEEAKEFSRPAAERYRPMSSSVPASTDLDLSDTSSSQGLSLIGYSRGRGRGAWIGKPKIPDVPVSSCGDPSLQEGETSGVASGGGSESGSPQPKPEGDPCSAEQLEEGIKEGETSETPDPSLDERSWGEIVEEELPEASLESTAEDREYVEQILHSAKGLSFDPAYSERRIESLPPRTFKQAVAHNMANCDLIRKAEDSCIPPGKGDVTKLPRLSRLQRVVHKRVALEYGYEYPYVPRPLLEEIESKRQTWCDDEVWEYLGVPKPCRDPSYPKYWETFLCCRQSWSLGRFIFKDKVLIIRERSKHQEFSINVFDPEGKMVQVPDPHYYR